MYRLLKLTRLYQFNSKVTPSYTCDPSKQTCRICTHTFSLKPRNGKSLTRKEGRNYCCYYILFENFPPCRNISLIRSNFAKLGWEKTVYFLAPLCFIGRCEGDLICPCIFLVVLKKYRPNFECHHICRVIVLCVSLGKGGGGSLPVVPANCVTIGSRVLLQKPFKAIL